jgi:flagellar export protein FliJ
MKQFRFRLERVLDLRMAAEREQARRLGEAHRHEEEQRQVVEKSVAHVGEITRQLAETPRELSTAGMLRNLLLTLEAAKAAAETAEQAHREAAARVDVETESFGRARQDRRAVERLREHRREAWEQDAARSEQQAQDEVALRRPRRRGNDA